MVRKLGIVSLGVTGVLSLGLISACSDRMGSFKSRTYTVEEYNAYAQEHGLPLFGVKQTPPPVDPTKDDTSKGLTRVEPTTPDFDKKDSPDVRPPAAPAAPAAPVGTPGTDQTGQNGPAAPVPNRPGQTAPVVSPANEEVVSGGFTRAKWEAEFNRLLSPEAKANPEYKKSTADVVKGFTITAGANSDKSKAVFDLSAVVLHGKDLAILNLNPTPVEVNYNKDKVMVIPFDLKKSSGSAISKADVGDLIYVTATCLKDEAPCTEFGVVIHFKTRKTDAKGKVVTGSVWVASKVKFADGNLVIEANGSKAAGVTDTNLSDVVAFTVAKDKMPTEKLVGGPVTPAQDVPVDVTVGEQVSNSELVAKALLIGPKVTASKEAAKAAMQKVIDAIRDKKLDEAKTQAEAAKAAAADAKKGQTTFVDLIAEATKIKALTGRALTDVEAMTKQIADDVSVADQSAAAAQKAIDEAPAQTSAPTAVPAAAPAAPAAATAQPPAAAQPGATNAAPVVKQLTTTDPEGLADIQMKEKAAADAAAAAKAKADAEAAAGQVPPKF